MSNTTPRFRIFAGPEGAGKTTFYKVLKDEKKIFSETYIGAARIEEHLKRGKGLHLATYKIKCTTEELKYHLLSNDRFALLPEDRRKLITDSLSVSEDILNVSDVNLINEELVSFISSFMVEKLIDSAQSFVYETVFADDEVFGYIQQSKAAGYKTTMYYLFLFDQSLYTLRVKSRAKTGRHYVADEKVIADIPGSYKRLPKALDVIDSAYIINNSDKPMMVGSKTGGVIKIERNSLPPEILECINEHHRSKRAVI